MKNCLWQMYQLKAHIIIISKTRKNLKTSLRSTQPIKCKKQIHQLFVKQLPDIKNHIWHFDLNAKKKNNLH